MSLDEDPTEQNRPDPRFKQTAVSHVQARDIQIGQIVQKTMYLGISSNSPLRPFALVISIALYLVLLIAGFVLLWRDGAGFVPLLLLIVGSGLLSLTCLYYAWFWKPEVQDISPPMPESSAAEEQVKRQRTKQRSRQQIRRLAIVGFFLIPLLTYGGFLGWRSLPPPKVLLLVANFNGVGQQSYGVTENILRNLRKATEPYADVKVQALNKTINERSVARAEGERRDATIVIWGEYGVSATNVQISTHLEVLKFPNYFPKLGITDKGTAQTLAIAELNSFKLQTRLSYEMGYLSLYILGMVSYAAKEWDRAIDYFSTALEQVEDRMPILDQSIIYLYRGNSRYFKSGNYEHPTIDFNQPIPFSSDRKDGYLDAITDFNQAIKLSPSLVEAYYNRGLAYRDSGALDPAMKDFKRVLELTGNPKLRGAAKQNLQMLGAQ